MPVAKGHYKDNKKVGTWDYYNDNNHLISVDKQITYCQNGTIKIDHLIERYSIEINNDTSVVIGYFNHDLDTIKINCQNEMCSLTLTDKRELKVF